MQRSLLCKLGVQELFLIYIADDEKIIVPKLVLAFSKISWIIYQQHRRYIFTEILSFAD